MKPHVKQQFRDAVAARDRPSHPWIARVSRPAPMAARSIIRQSPRS
jgi:hypothetical protein